MRIEFKKQPGTDTPLVLLSSTDVQMKAIMDSIYNESIRLGMNLQLIDVEKDKNNFVESMKLGLVSEYPIADITEDNIAYGFFQPNRSYLFVCVKNTSDKIATLSGGITDAGTELFSNERIAANDITLIKIDRSFNESTPFYLHAGVGDEWNSAVLNIKSVSV